MTIRPLTAAEVRVAVKALGLRPDSARGHNFLHDDAAVRRVATAGHVRRGDQVLQIGAGLGSLTLALLGKGAHVSAVEVHPLLAGHLPTVVAEHCHGEIARLQVLHRDGLGLRQEDVAVPPDVAMISVRADIAEPVVLRTLDQFPSVRTVVLLTDLELVWRLAAGPGDPRYHSSGVKLRSFGTVARLGTIFPSAFWPSPRAPYGLLGLRRDTGHLGIGEDRARGRLFDLIDTAFADRRNSARHAFTGWAGSGAEAARRLLVASIDPARRADDLTVDDFRRLQQRSFFPPEGPVAGTVQPHVP